MRKSYGLGLIFLIFIFISCYRDPGFPSAPVITYKSIAFIKSDSNQSIRVVINFTDGDGDLGLEESDSLAPFNKIIKYDSVIGGPVETNPNRINYDVVYLYKNPDTTFKRCAESIDICVEKTDKLLLSILGRFPDLNPDRKKRPISGELTYNINSTQFVALLGGKTLKLRIFIKDRALHNSNTIETDSLSIR